MVRRTFFTIIIAVSALNQSFSQERAFSFYLIGDAGERMVADNGLPESIRQHYDSSIRSVAVFLGDNIYPKGMPSPEEKSRREAEAIVKAQIDMLNGFQGDIFFIPGNHDWKRGKQDGLQRLLNQQQWIDSLHNKSIHFFPQGGCPGPVEIDVTDSIVLVIIDSQWFLHPWDKPEGDDSPCEVKQPEDVVVELEDIFERNRGKRILVTAHHPIVTYGQHGGVFTIKDHIFPLTSLKPDLYIPLPGLGSIYAGYRKFFGHRQDIAHPLNKQYRQLISGLLERYPGVFYANGHEHALEYAWRDSVHYITSGAGVKNTTVRKKGFAKFVSDKQGFVRIDVFKDGSAVINYFEAFKTEPVYSVSVKALPGTFATAPEKLPDLRQTVRVHASDRYTARGLKRIMLGENYRKEWKQDVEVPWFDIGKTHGGLKIVQRGGGMQTLSLRLADSAGHEYTLRSIEKFPEKAVPDILKKTFAQDLVQDQISAAHPYGALVISPLAEAAGIYHTNPKVVYLPDDSRLGTYRKEFGNTLALFEERPEGNAADKPYFGNAKKIISTDKVLEKLKEDADNHVDQPFALRSRLLDMVIGDWDRHDDQWRWAVFKEKKGEHYRPIPRDRDQAFFLGDGVLAKVWSRKWALPKFEGFRDEIRWPSGLMYNARYFDRSFLNALPAATWKEESRRIQQSLTDGVITSAIQQFPESIYKLHGEEIIRKLKARRDRLTSYALEHYAFLSREVEVPGSDKRDWFVMRRESNGDATLTVFKINKQGVKTDSTYTRIFHPSETREIRLFGLGGDDVFEFQGERKNGIRTRVIGGDGRDSLLNMAPGKIKVYDLPSGIAVSNWSGVSDHTSTDPAVNQYDRKAFKYPRLAPLLYGNFNYDDGLFFGGGFLMTTHGFRKKPYKSQHIFLASYAPLTNSYNFKYDGRFTQVFGKFGMEIDFDWKAPNFVNNFFGWGNETVFDDDIDDTPGYSLHRPIDYYRIRLQQVEYQAMLTYPMGLGTVLKSGPVFQRVEIEEPKNPNRFIAEYAQELDVPFFEIGKSFAGWTGELIMDKRNHPQLTTRGALFTHRSIFMHGIESNAGNYTAHTTALSLYHTFRIPTKVTFAARAGGGLNTGDYELYQAQILDGKTELRGYRKTRFYGDRRFYNNNEIRIKLASFRSYLFPATLGINAFYDVGRVWYKDDTGRDPSSPDGKSHLWHHGWGGGLWFTPFNLTVLSAEVAHSDDGNMVYVRLGFLF